MKALIAWVMKGRTQAIMATVLLALMPLLSLFSAAIVVLATLRNGAKEGLVVFLGALGILFVLGYLLAGMPYEFGRHGLYLFLPAWIAGLILGQTGSLSRTVEMIAFFVVVSIVVQFVQQTPEHILQMELELEKLSHIWAEAMPNVDWSEVIKTASGLILSLKAVAEFVSILLAVLLALWMQAKLQGSNLFATSFRKIALSKIWLISGLGLLVLGAAGDSASELASQFYVLFLVLFAVQGLSVAHAWVYLTNSHAGWLYSLYLVLFVVVPWGLLAIAAAGFADGWLNFRAKIQSKD